MGAVTLRAARSRAPWGLYRSEPPGTIIELGPGTGPVNRGAGARKASTPRGSLLVEYDKDLLPAVACALSKATVGAGRRLQPQRLLGGPSQIRTRAWCRLPLFTSRRMRFASCSKPSILMSRAPPFIKFTYNAGSPDPEALEVVSAEPSEQGMDGISRRRGCGSIGETDDDIRRKRWYGVVAIRSFRPSVVVRPFRKFVIPGCCAAKSYKGRLLAREQGT